MRHLIFLLVLLFVTSATAVIFDLKPNAPRCLQEEIRRGVPFTGEYSVSAVENADPISAGRFPRSFVVHFSDQNNKELYRNEGAAGNFAFTPENDGTVNMCFTDSVRGAGWRVHQTRSVALKIRHGITTKDYADIAKKEKLFPLGVELRRLEDEVWNVREEMIYQRKREEELRDVNEEVNSRAAWFPVFALIVMGCSSLWQLVYLRQFFQKKKLI